MTDNIDKPQGGDTDKLQGGSGPAQGASDTKPTHDADLLRKIDELERDNKKYRDERRAQETAAKKAQDEHLASQQKWQELAESRAAELDRLKPVAEQYESITIAFNASLDSRLKQIPEDTRKRTVDPIRAALSPADFSNWLDANLEMLRGRQAPNLDGGAGSIGASAKAVTLTPDQIEMARAAGMTIDEYSQVLRRIEANRGGSWQPPTK